MTIDQDQRIVMTLDAGGTKFAFRPYRPAGRSSRRSSCRAMAMICRCACRRSSTASRKSSRARGKAGGHQLRLSRPGRLCFGRDRRPGQSAGLPRRRAAGPDARRGVRTAGVHQQRRRPVCLWRGYRRTSAANNEKLAAAGAPKRYKNLLGVTLGTGFGAGIVHDGRLFLGDNGAGAEIWDLRSKLHPRCPAEEDVSIRAVERVYAGEGGGGGRGRGQVGGQGPRPRPKKSSRSPWAAPGQPGGRPAGLRRPRREHRRRPGQRRYAGGRTGGDRRRAGRCRGAFLPQVVAEMNSTLESITGAKIPRMELKAFNLEDPKEIEVFLRGDAREMASPGRPQDKI